MAELDLGRIRFFDRGEYSFGTEYVLWDFVTSNGSTYLYINKESSTGKPLTDEFYWKCLAKRGLSAFEVWDIMNGGNKTEAQFFDFIQSPANDAKDDYYDVVKPAIQAQGVYAQAQGDYAQAQGDYAKAQGEAVEGDIAQLESDVEQLESDVEQLESDVKETTEKPTAQSLSELNARIAALEAILTNKIKDRVDVTKEFNVWGKTNLILYGGGASSKVPDFIGQTYIDTTNGNVYIAVGVSNAGNWKLV